MRYVKAYNANLKKLWNVSQLWIFVSQFRAKNYGVEYMNFNEIKKDLDYFQKVVKQLSTKISKAATLWKDQKFSELSNSVRNVANQSCDVLLTGEKLCSSIDKFDKIASEEY